MSRSALRVLTNAPLVAAAAISVASAAHAQVTTGTVSGVVRDDAGAPIKGAIVRLRPASGGTAKLAKTDGSGAFQFLGVEPGAYTLAVEVVTFKTAAQDVTVIQDTVTTANIALSKETKQTGKTTVRVAPVQRTEVKTQYNISARTEQLTKSQPNNLYQFPGLVFGQPGIIPDSGGYTHIRGSDINQVGFEVDGIKVTEPMTNTFATNLVTVGLKSANLITGGADATYGGASGGFVNEVTNNGRDVRGGHIEYTQSTNGGWNYYGTQSDYGNVTKNGKFDYYLATILFQNNFPGNTQISKVNPSQDILGKVNWYADANNTVTLYANTGKEKYTYFLDPAGLTPPFPHFDPKTGNISSNNNVPFNGDDQGYDFYYAGFKHNFSPTSVLNLRQYRLFSHVKFYEDQVAHVYAERQSTQNGTQLDYTNQFSKVYQLQTGLEYVPARTHVRNISAASGGYDTLSNSTPYLNDRSSYVAPKETALYMANQFKLLDNKATLNLGLRYSQQDDKLKSPDVLGVLAAGVDPNSSAGFNKNYDRLKDHYIYGSKYKPNYTDPRVGLTYSPTTDLVFRTSYAVQSQFADTRRLETIPTAFVGDQAPTVIDSSFTAAQQLYYLRRNVPFNKLGPQHTDNFDLGFEKGFIATDGLLKGSYSLALTGFRRTMRDLIQYDRGSFDLVNTGSSSNRPVFYTTDGRGHSSGTEFIFTKKPVKKTDWNGFISWTDQVAKATNSDTDTVYVPYFFNAAAGDPNLTDADYRRLNKTEFSTSYDQKHTIAVVLNKRVNRIFETSAYLDAGSGFPFSGGTASDGGFAGGADSQHSEKVDGQADFTQVPTVLLDQKTLQPINPVVGRTGWHYKISWNNNFYVNDNSWFFLNIDNVFSKKTATTFATSTLAGQIYYLQPTAEYPQGRVFYGPQTILTPRFITVGFRTKF